MAQHSIVIDKGHLSSDGSTVVEFWVAQPPGNTTQQDVCNLTGVSADVSGIGFGQRAGDHDASQTDVADQDQFVVTDNDVIDRALHETGIVQGIAVVLDSFEGRFHDRLDAMAFQIARKANYSCSSWEDFRATVSAIVEEDAFHSRNDLSLAGVLQYASEVYGPLPEQTGKRSRHE